MDDLHREKKGGLEIAIILAVFLITYIASEIYQPQITLNKGQSFDGVFYYQVANQISKGLKIRSEGPFVYRIGTPFLVSVFFKNDLLYGFKVINIIANLFSTILFIFWLRLFLKDWRIRSILVILFITAWHGPVRFTIYDPTYTDPWLFVILLIGLILIEQVKRLVKKNHSSAGPSNWSLIKVSIILIVCVGLISFIGVFFREVVLIIPVALVFITNPIPHIHEVIHPLAYGQLKKMLKKPFYLSIFPLLMGIAAIFLVRSVASQNNDYSFIKTARDWAYEKPALTYLHAYFITFGPLILVPVYFWRRTLNFLRNNQHLQIFLAIFLILAWIGGSDTERFLFWAMPVFYLLIGIVIVENINLFKSPLLILLLVGSSICSLRLFWIVADYPNSFVTPFPILSILSNKFQYLDLWSYFANRSIQVKSLAEYLLLSGVILVWFQRRMDKITSVT